MTPDAHDRSDPGLRPVVANVGDDRLPRLRLREQRLEPHANQRRNVRAVSDDSPGMARYSAGNSPVRRSPRKRGDHVLRHFGGVDRPRALVRGQRTDRVALLFENGADRRERPRIGRVELDGAAIVLEGVAPADRPAARRSPGLDTGTLIQAMRQSPADRSPSPRPIAARRPLPWRAPASPAWRGTAAHRRGCATRSATDPSRAPLRSSPAPRRRDRARAAPGRGQPAPARTRHRLRARARTASAASLSLPRASAT